MTALWVGAAVCALAAVAAIVLARGGGMTVVPQREDLLLDDAELASAGLTGPR